MDEDVSEDRAVGVTVEKSKLGDGGVDVPSNSGVLTVSGVEACSVANRSGGGVEAAGTLHPATRDRINTTDARLNLFIVGLDVFNMEFLTR